MAGKDISFDGSEKSELLPLGAGRGQDMQTLEATLQVRLNSCHVFGAAICILRSPLSYYNLTVPCAFSACLSHLYDWLLTYLPTYLVACLLTSLTPLTYWLNFPRYILHLSCLRDVFIFQQGASVGMYIRTYWLLYMHVWLHFTLPKFSYTYWLCFACGPSTIFYLLTICTLS